jgi:two-component system sensor histidine kinase KdpD
VPPADRERIFEPFQRLGDRARGSGVGLGLAVARGFTVAMGGELVLEDTPGGGLTAVISLKPAGVPATPEAERDAQLIPDWGEPEGRG